MTTTDLVNFIMTNRRSSFALLEYCENPASMSKNRVVGPWKGCNHMNDREIQEMLDQAPEDATVKIILYSSTMVYHKRGGVWEPWYEIHYRDDVVQTLPDNGQLYYKVGGLAIKTRITRQEADRLPTWSAVICQEGSAYTYYTRLRKGWRVKSLEVKHWEKNNP